MALFGWKKSSDEKASTAGGGAGAGNGSGGAAAGTPGGGGGYEFSPEKAARWFEHGKNQSEIGNNAYAMTCWLSGLRFEPTNLDAIKAFFKSAAENGAGIPKDVASAVGGKTDVDRFLSALLAFACKTSDAELGVRVVVAASEIGLTDVVNFLAPIALKVALDAPKPRKDQFIKIMQACIKSSSFELAVRAGEAALRIDPADTRLATDVRNLAAQSTMSKGGYDQTGEAGGFRSNVRDAAKQQQLEEQERVVRSGSVQDRVIAANKEEYEARPTDRPTILKYVDSLWDRKRREDVELALQILAKAYQETQEFRFREKSGEFKMRIGRARVKALREAANANPSDATAQAALADAAKKLLDLEVSEFEACVSAYPTDVTRKFELGKRYFEAARYNDAIDLLQQAKDDTKNKLAVLSYLGRSFASMDWHEEAIGTFRLALEGLADPNDPAAMELRYGLLCSLQKHAEDQKDVAAGEEALKLAQQIAVQQISFKDVRARRDEIKAIIARLKA